MKRLGTLFFMGYVLSGSVAHAATYYVSKAGSNSNSCAQAQSPNSSKLTIVAGIACLAQGGDTLFVRNGNYDEGIRNSPSGVSWSNKVRIAAYPGDTAVWLKPLVNQAGNNGFCIDLSAGQKYIEFDGINIDHRNIGEFIAVRIGAGNTTTPIRIQNAEVIEGSVGFAGAIQLWSDHNELINLTVHGGGIDAGCGVMCFSYGVYVAGDDNLLDGLNIYNTSSAGIQIYHNGGSANNNTVRNTRIHDIARSGDPSPGARLWGMIITGSGNQIYNNLIYNSGIANGASGDAGLAIGGTGSGTKIWNNTIYDFIGDGIFIDVHQSNAEVKNNIVYNVTASAFRDAGTGTVTATNLLNINPQFVNAGAGDFSLTAGSPARNASTAIAVVTTDIIGTARPQEGAPDIGAYEFQGSTAAPAAPAAPTGLRIVN